MRRKIINVVFIMVMLLGLLLLSGCGKKYENIIVYINDGLDESKITSIGNKLKGFENVNSVQYTSKENAYEEAKEKLGQEALDISGYTKSIHPFLAYFTLEVKNNKNYDDLIKEIESVDGVKTVKVGANFKDLVNSEMNYIKK